MCHLQNLCHACPNKHMFGKWGVGGYHPPPLFPLLARDGVEIRLKKCWHNYFRFRGQLQNSVWPKGREILAEAGGVMWKSVAKFKEICPLNPVISLVLWNPRKKETNFNYWYLRIEGNLATDLRTRLETRLVIPSYVIYEVGDNTCPCQCQGGDTSPTTYFGTRSILFLSHISMHTGLTAAWALSSFEIPTSAPLIAALVTITPLPLVYQFVYST